MLIKKLFLLFTLLITSLLLTCSIEASTWKIFFYMDASDGLTDMAFKNITDIIRGKAQDINNTVDVVIQLHAYDQVALRYRVTDKGLIFVAETTLSSNCKKDFIDAATWAFSNNTSDHIMLIFSNHGYGALDPHWNKDTGSGKLLILTFQIMIANHAFYTSLKDAQIL